MALVALVVAVGCDGPASVLEPACRLGWVDIRLQVPVEEDDVDLLLVVDPSRSIENDRESVLRELTRAIRVLASGDHDEDGLLDWTPARSIRVAVISSDLGAGALHEGAPVAGCEPGTGDGGAFLTAGDTSRPGCAAEYPAVQDVFHDDDPAAFAESIACVVSAVRGGCGVEQPLEAALAALSLSAANESVPPGYVPPAFAAGLRPLGDGVNAGFLRPRSMLGIVLVTDEDDTSLAVPRLDDGGAALAVPSGDPVLGASALGRDLLPALRYVEGFLALRQNPAMLVVGAVAGAPTDRAGSHVSAYDALLADDRMVERTEPTPSEARRLVASCATADGGEAFPPRRLVEVLRGLELRGAGTTMQSICASDFRPVFDRAIPLLWDRIGGACLPRPLALDSAGRPDCDVALLLPAAERGVSVTSCADFPAADARIGVETDALGRARERCAIRRLGYDEVVVGTTAGWFYDTSAEVIATCGGAAPPGQRISLLNAALPGGAELHIRCRSPIPAYAEDGGGPLTGCEP